MILAGDKLPSTKRAPWNLAQEEAVVTVGVAAESAEAIGKTPFKNTLFAISLREGVLFVTMLNVVYYDTECYGYNTGTHRYSQEPREKTFWRMEECCHRSCD